MRRSVVIAFARGEMSDDLRVRDLVGMHVRLCNKCAELAKIIREADAAPKLSEAEAREVLARCQ